MAARMVDQQKSSQVHMVTMCSDSANEYRRPDAVGTAPQYEFTYAVPTLLRIALCVMRHNAVAVLHELCVYMDIGQ
jgi:hypothetical protein